MANFALIKNSVVLNIIVIDDSNCGSGVFPESEQAGRDFILSLGIEGEWIQTSPDGKFRSNYALIGSVYDSTLDAFINPKPFDSWILNSTNQWNAPTPQPEGNFYWDESSLSWFPIPISG
jgi:hypothetical protein